MRSFYRVSRAVIFAVGVTFPCAYTTCQHGECPTYSSNHSDINDLAIVVRRVIVPDTRREQFTGSKRSAAVSGSAAFAVSMPWQEYSHPLRTSQYQVGCRVRKQQNSCLIPANVRLQSNWFIASRTAMGRSLRISSMLSEFPRRVCRQRRSGAGV